MEIEYLKQCLKRVRSSESIEPLVTRITQTTTSKTSITVLTPPEDPNAHITFYLCTRNPFGSYGDDFTWFKIDPTDDSASESTAVALVGDKKKKKNLKILSPILNMPHTTPGYFRPVPHAPLNRIYAFGGLDCAHQKTTFSSKASFCDLSDSSTNYGIWQDLPPLPSPLRIHSALVSPLDDHIYVFGFLPTPQTFPRSRYVSQRTSNYVSEVAGAAAGMIFNPISGSWTTCRPPHNIRNIDSVTDYTLVQNTSQFVLFDGVDERPLFFNLHTGEWDRRIFHTIPRDLFKLDKASLGRSCVAVGNIIYKLVDRKLCSLDLTTAHKCFEEVLGFEDMLPTHYETRFKGYLFYIGQGKLCIVWGRAPFPKGNKEKEIGIIIYITSLTFWVGTCDRKNRPRAIIDKCHRYATCEGGGQLYDVIAL